MIGQAPQPQRGRTKVLAHPALPTLQITLRPVRRCADTGRMGHCAESTNWRCRVPSVGPILTAMKKRALAALLWFYAAWYAGAMVAHVLGLSPALGPILGVAAAAIVAGDPRRLIWSRTSAHTDRTAPATTGQQLQHPA